MLRAVLLALTLAIAGCASESGPSARYPEFAARAARLDSMSAIVDVTLSRWPLYPREPRQFDEWQGRIAGDALAQRLATGLRARGYPVARAVLASQGGSWPANQPKPDRFAMLRSEADTRLVDPTPLPVEASPFIVAADLAARPEAGARLTTLYRALQAREIAAGSEDERPIAVAAAVATLVAPEQAALVVLEVWATRPSSQLVMSEAIQQLVEEQAGRPLPRSPGRRNIDSTFAESLRLSIIETASGRVLWSDAHAAEGGGYKPDALEAALDTLLSHVPRRR